MKALIMIVGLCEDLTSDKAKVLPVAALLLVKTDTLHVVMKRHPLEDQLTSDIIGNLDLYVMEMHEGVNESLDELVVRVRDSFKFTSLSVLEAMKVELPLIADFGFGL